MLTCTQTFAQELKFDQLPTAWDEAVPLGNGICGTLVWQKGDHLRLTLDRADLWDLRPVKEFSGPNYTFDFIRQAVANKDMKPVYEMIDARTSKDIAPTKIPAGAIEIPIAKLGKVKQVELDVHRALCTITWQQGTVGKFFQSATDKRGYFRFTHLPDTLSILLQTPRYELAKGEKEQRTSLSRLGYKNGKVKRGKQSIHYHQEAYAPVSYDVDVTWTMPDKETLEGCYLITSNGTWYSESKSEQKQSASGGKRFDEALSGHEAWWKSYWTQSEIHLPDPVLERQYMLEMYKFGAASRKAAPPICLQAVWTADNGQTPPWRGDFHNDLNTQLSYWPGYAANHLDESAVFTDWLWKIKGTSEAYTRQFFGVEGMAVACIATLEGHNLGGWNPYSHSPSAAGWLAHHFYQQWKYSADGEFLQNRAYPWVKEAARFFEHIAVKGADGKMKLPLSSSPEINDNALEAWFTETTNYDLACIRFTFRAAAEMAKALSLDEEARHWSEQEALWPDFATDATGLTVAPNYPLPYTHRHLSNMMAIHPLGLIDVSQGREAERLIRRSIHHFEEVDNRGWVGYTYSWLANLHARVFDGDAAARNLHIFAKAFCSPNSFHLNGDQLKQGYSGFTYRPFTLEGNFAFASAIHEMLMQSHTGIIRLFPALPESWREASFRDLRAEGAFLVSADYRNGRVQQATIRSEKGGEVKLFNPFTRKVESRILQPGEVWEISR